MLSNRLEQPVGIAVRATRPQRALMPGAARRISPNTAFPMGDVCPHAWSPPV